MQAAVFEVLAKHGQIELLLQSEHQPEYFFGRSLEILFETIVNNRMYQMLPLIEALLDQQWDSKRHYRSSERSIIQAAWALADLGNVAKAQEVVQKLLDESKPKIVGSKSRWVLHDIVKGIYLLPSQYALSVIDDILVEAQSREQNSGFYEEGLCIVALQRIGTPQACAKLIEICEITVASDKSGILIDEIITSLIVIGAIDRETWLLNLLERLPENSIGFNRVIDALGLLGSRNSLPILQSHFELSSDELKSTFCFWAIHNINKRHGMLWFNNEERCK